MRLHSIDFVSLITLDDSMTAAGWIPRQALLLHPWGNGGYCSLWWSRAELKQRVSEGGTLRVAETTDVYVDPKVLQKHRQADLCEMHHQGCVVR